MLKVLALILVLHFAAAARNSLYDGGDSNERSRQNFADKTNNLLGFQVRLELQASYFYQAMAQYFARDDVALPGHHSFFEKASKDEREHATKFMDYINMRGGDVLLEDIKLHDVCEVLLEEAGRMKKCDHTDAVCKRMMQEEGVACICDYMDAKSGAKAVSSSCGERIGWRNGWYAMKDSLVIERFINQQLLNLHGKVSADAHLSHFLEHEYLDEQVTSIKEFADLVRQHERVGAGLGEFMIDQKLS